MKLCFWAGLTVFAGSCFYLPGKLKQLEAEQHAAPVKMQIVAINNDSVNSDTVLLQYNDRNYSIKATTDFRKTHTLHDQVDMKYFNKTDTVLFPDESVMPDVMATVMLGSFALGVAIYRWITR